MHRVQSLLVNGRNQPMFLILGLFPLVFLNYCIQSNLLLQQKVFLKCKSSIEVIRDSETYGIVSATLSIHLSSFSIENYLLPIIPLRFGDKIPSLISEFFLLVIFLMIKYPAAVCDRTF